MVLSFKDEDVHKFMQYIEKLAKDYEFNLPYGSYDIYAFAKDLLVCLENQSEQKPQGKSALEAVKEEKVNNANKVEPEFKVGDWITFYGGNPYKILKIEEKINGVLDYLLLDQNGHNYYFNNTYADKNVRLWTIQDAKDGDVLACKEDILLFKSYSVQRRISLYCWYNGRTNNLYSKEVTDISLSKRNKICPATKEQRDLLFQKMKESGYEWDAEKKELKKLVPNRFDPKTLKPFDKVLVRDKNSDNWCCGYFSHINVSFDVYRYVTGGTHYKMCIPYNDDTKHLIGTTDEAPEYYRYWEDCI